MANGLIRFCKDCGDSLKSTGGSRWVSDRERGVEWSCPGCGARAFSTEPTLDLLSSAEWEWVEANDGSQHLALAVDGWPIDVSSFVHLRKVEGMGWVEVPLFYGPDDPGPLGKLIRGLISQRLDELRAGSAQGKAGKVGRPIYKPWPRLSYLWRKRGYQLQWPEMFLDGWPIDVASRVCFIALLPGEKEGVEEWVVVVRTPRGLRKLKEFDTSRENVSASPVPAGIRGVKMPGIVGALSIEIAEVFNQRLSLLKQSHERITMRKPRSTKLPTR